jgi:hypothetical protein
VPTEGHGDAPFILSALVPYLPKAAISGLVLCIFPQDSHFWAWNQLPFLETVLPGSGDLYLRAPHLSSPFILMRTLFCFTLLIICMTFFGELSSSITIFQLGYLVLLFVLLSFWSSS